MYCQQWVQLLTSDLETRAWLYEGHQRYAQAALLLSQSGSLTPPTIHAPLARPLNCIACRELAKDSLGHA